ncbi:hypothetical protein FQA39_LY01059 [Lamprigera yunnana]|nr:hypothetical protein FQA39_LY01059 [Lamprigera yunnana]
MMGDTIVSGEGLPAHAPDHGRDVDGYIDVVIATTSEKTVQSEMRQDEVFLIATLSADLASKIARFNSDAVFNGGTYADLRDESGCEADMAEGGTEEESGDMLVPAIAPAHQPPAINMKAEEIYKSYWEYQIWKVISDRIGISINTATKQQLHPKLFALN